MPRHLLTLFFCHSIPKIHSCRILRAYTVHTSVCAHFYFVLALSRCLGHAHMEGFKDPRIAVSVSAKTPHVLTCIGLMISPWLGLSYFIRYGGRGGLKLKVLKRNFQIAPSRTQLGSA